MLKINQPKQVFSLARGVFQQPAKRSASVPDVPSIAEIIPGFDFSVSVGALARTGTPPEISKRIADEIAQVVKLPDVWSPSGRVGQGRRC
ncbi:MAG: hypothetical protein JNK28_09530 [Burkholderiaceae bacterium]|nr:hypothetical protein [Burkholderiaceae bacterium]